MATIRPFLSSGVRLGVVPDDHRSPEESTESLEKSDFSEDLEGSCELMNDVTSDAGNNDDEAKRYNDEQRSQRIRKKWEDYFDSINDRDGD